MIKLTIYIKVFIFSFILLVILLLNIKVYIENTKIKIEVLKIKIPIHYKIKKKKQKKLINKKLIKNILSNIELKEFKLITYIPYSETNYDSLIYISVQQGYLLIKNTIDNNIKKHNNERLIINLSSINESYDLYFHCIINIKIANIINILLKKVIGD